MITHRCKELLTYNKKFFKPCSIQYKKWNEYTKNSDNEWILSSLSFSDEWGSEYMSNIAKIMFCPFCSKKLEKIIETE